MRNMLFAYAALGLIAVASSVNAQEPASVLQDAAQSVVQGVQADAAIVDHQPIAAESMSQPMASQPMVAQPMHQHIVTQGEAATVAPAYTVHQHQPAHVHYNYHRAAPKKQNAFQKLMELERKKNAWLKKTFLGR